MGNDLAIFEQQLKPLTPHYEAVLAGTMPVERFMRTAMISIERNPSLLDASRQSLINTIMSAGVLGLEMDGVTGQAFPIPFKGKVQLVIGYKGYNTMAARSAITITGEVVREGDTFDFDLGEAWVKHKPKGIKGARVIGAWAKAAAHDRPSVISFLGIDEIMAIKEKSPGARKSESPWNDTAIGFPAMASKSAKRRLARSLPLNIMQLAARMEEAFEEQGRPGFIKPNGELIIEGESSPIAEIHHNNETPAAEMLAAPKPGPDPLAAIKADGEIAARDGMQSLQIWFRDLPRNIQAQIKPYLDDTLKDMADKFDREALQA